jgi:hypothetical protein
MADSTIKAIYLVLTDTVRGYTSPDQSIPLDGFAGADHHNVAAAKYPLGTKKYVYIPSLKQWSGLTYLQTSAASGTAIAAGMVMIPDDVTNNASYYPTKFTNDPDEGLLGGPMAVAISAMTDDYYGWFWTDGCAPVGHGSMTATTTVATDDSVAITTASSFSTCDLTADKAGIKVLTAGLVPCGWAIKSDG